MKKLLVAVAVLGMVAASEAATLTWTDNSNNEQGFKIYRKSEVCTGTAPFGLLGSVGPDSVTYVDGTPVKGQQYCYRLTAYNADGESAPSNSAGFLDPFIVPLSPSGLTVNP